MEITKLVWGQITLSNNTVYKDCIVTPKWVKEWDWRLDGTNHNPGITIDAVKNLTGCCDVIIISRGMDLKLKTRSDTEDYLKLIEKEYYILESRQAASEYNKRVKNSEKVGLLLHSTC